jgi:hypothetical protein
MSNSDSLVTRKFGAEDVEVMQNRVNWLDMLYKLEGRDNKDHKMHGLYTGLHAKHHSTFPGTDDL